jgi:flagellar biosynthesis protein FlhA
VATPHFRSIKRFGADLLTRQEVQKLVDLVKGSHPAAVERTFGSSWTGVRSKSVAESHPGSRSPFGIWCAFSKPLRILAESPEWGFSHREGSRISCQGHITLPSQLAGKGRSRWETLSTRWEKEGERVRSWRSCAGVEPCHEPSGKLQQLIAAVSPVLWSSRLFPGHVPVYACGSRRCGLWFGDS